jgi:cell wall-associated NlpC family hydrolase
MRENDPRLTPARPDLAALHLQGRVQAARFVESEKREVADAQAALRRTPSPDALLETQALKGERVAVYETTEEGWCWVQLESDGYVGYMPANALVAPGPAPTHKVATLRTLVFPGANIKLPPVEALPFGARVAVSRFQDKFAVTVDGGFIPAIHLVALDRMETDFVAVAQRFLGAPYLWGGKTNDGIDCSGLVQVALTACGMTCPRDADLQEEALGEALDPACVADGLERGDLVFWPGHVAIVHDRDTLLHANAFHMAVAFEPLGAAIARIRASGSEVRTIRRLRG